MLEYKNIILIGFMGCGKSTVGYELAKKLNFEFVDADSAIEKITGQSIAEIFEQQGEAGFRQLEEEYLRHLYDQGVTGQILATGGGMAILPKNQEYMKKLGVVVWLDAKFEVIWQRVKNAKHRPLVTNTSAAKAQLAKLYEYRVAAYTQACDLRIELDKLSLDEIILGIIESIRYSKKL